MQTEVGPVEIEVPRDRAGTVEPGIVRKRQRRLDGIDEIALSLTARGLTTGEVAAHFAGPGQRNRVRDLVPSVLDEVGRGWVRRFSRPM